MHKLGSGEDRKKKHSSGKKGGGASKISCRVFRKPLSMRERRGYPPSSSSIKGGGREEGVKNPIKRGKNGHWLLLFSGGRRGAFETSILGKTRGGKRARAIQRDRPKEEGGGDAGRKPGREERKEVFLMSSIFKLEARKGKVERDYLSLGRKNRAYH